MLAAKPHWLQGFGGDFTASVYIYCSVTHQRSVLACSLQPAVQPNEEDQQALLTVRGIYDIVQPGFSQDRDDVQRRQLWNELWSLLPEILPGLGLTGKALCCSISRDILLLICLTPQQLDSRRLYHAGQNTACLMRQDMGNTYLASVPECGICWCCSSFCCIILSTC